MLLLFAEEQSFRLADPPSKPNMICVSRTYVARSAEYFNWRRRRRSRSRRRKQHPGFATVTQSVFKAPAGGQVKNAALEPPAGCLYRGSCRVESSLFEKSNKIEQNCKRQYYNSGGDGCP